MTKYADLRQAAPYALYLQKLGWQIAEYKVLSSKYKAYFRRLPFLPFSVIKVQRPEKINFHRLDHLAKKYRAVFLKLEPRQDSKEIREQLGHWGYQLSPSPFLPTKTLQLDLTQSEEKIFSQFKKDCRYEIRRAKKNNLKIFIIKSRGEPVQFLRSEKESFLHRKKLLTGDLSGSSILTFISLWQHHAFRRGFWLSLKKEIRTIYEVFGKNAFLVMIYRSNEVNHQTKPLAGALIVVSDKVVYYCYAASTPAGRQLSAPYLVVWEAVKEAKKQGGRLFDFEGIYDQRFPHRSWLGFSHFKQSFGGQEVEYPGCFTKFYFPFSAFPPRLLTAMLHRLV